MARQTRALESIAASLTTIIIGVETICALYVIFVFGSALANKLWEKTPV